MNLESFQSYNVEWTVHRRHTKVVEPTKFQDTSCKTDDVRSVQNIRNLKGSHLGVGSDRDVLDQDLIGAGSGRKRRLRVCLESGSLFVGEDDGRVRHGGRGELGAMKRFGGWAEDGGWN